MNLRCALVAIFAAALVACPAALGCSSKDRSSQADATTDGSEISVSGRVLLSPPLPSLPANARLTLKLQDISLADAPSKLLASRTVDSVAATYSATAGIPFTMAATVPTSTPFIGNSVAVSAELSGDGVSYFTDTMYFVDLTPGTFQYREVVVTIVKART